MLGANWGRPSDGDLNIVNNIIYKNIFGLLETFNGLKELFPVCKADMYIIPHL